MPEQPKKKSKALMITLIVLSVVLVLCIGGGVAAYLLVGRNAQGGTGASDPKAAAGNFLQAVYKDQSATKVATTVCSQARDSKAIADQVKAIQDLSTTYSSPNFAWDTLTVSDQTTDSAKIDVKLTMTTADEKVSKQELVLTTINDHGWWVCESSPSKATSEQVASSEW